MAKTFYLWEKEDYQYPCTGEFLPNITVYLHDDEKIRPAMLVVPGGGYAVVSPTEGEIVTKRFFEEGYQAFLAVHYQDPDLKEKSCQEISNRPDAVLLCYPVITNGEKAHRESFGTLLGKEADELVPVENSILYVQACREAGVPCELHLFMKVKHGMSLANEDWASNNLGEDSIYTMMQ